MSCPHFLPSLRYSSCCRLTQWVSGSRSAHSAAAAAAVSYQGAPAIKSAGPSDPSAPAMAGEFWINLFGSCVMEQEPQPNRCLCQPVINKQKSKLNVSRSFHIHQATRAPCSPCPRCQAASQDQQGHDRTADQLSPHLSRRILGHWVTFSFRFSIINCHHMLTNSSL